MKRRLGLSDLKRWYEAMVRDEEARGILPHERELLGKLK